jgi:hypothetical protein
VRFNINCIKNQKCAKNAGGPIGPPAISLFHQPRHQNIAAAQEIHHALGRKRLARHLRNIDQLSLTDAILVGLAQAFAVFPGISRSGSTITAGLALGLERETAARFSFLLSAPIIAGAGAKSAYDIFKGIQAGTIAPNEFVLFPLGFIAAAISGYLCIKFLLRYLQSEVEHVTKQQGDQTAISDQNYKFSLKSTEEMNGHRCYVFQVKPVKKRVGLFKGRVFLDADTGAIRRAEGSFVKSPSWWIKKIEFVQDFDEIGGFNLPVKLASISKVRVIGRTVVNVFHNNYQTVATTRSQQVVSLGGGAQ